MVDRITNGTRIMSRSPFVQGTRVDCLFDDDYFRGTVDATTIDGEKRNLFRVCFDDGDVRDDVPEEDMELPLEPGIRVQCIFEDDEAYFDGAIGRDNSDATYLVTFDDGDVLVAAPRRDIQIVSPPTNHKSAKGDADQAQDVHGYTGNLEDACCEREGHMKEGPDGNAVNSVGSTAEDINSRQYWAHERGDMKYSKPKTGPVDSHLKQTVPDRQHQDAGNAQNAERETSCAPDCSGGEGDGVSGGKRGIYSSRADIANKAERTSGDDSGGGARHFCSGRQERFNQERSPAFIPAAHNPVHAYIEALAAATPRLMEDAPPDFRLWAVSYQMVALEDQLREQEAKGETWNDSILFVEGVMGGSNTLSSGRKFHPRRYDNESGGYAGGRTRGATSKEGAVASSFPANLGLRKMVENLSTLRIRQMALVRLCYGDSSLDMVQALCDLAEGYAKEGLWPQVSNHMTRVADILAGLHGPEQFDDGGAFGTREGGWRNLDSTCGDANLHNLQAEEGSSKLLFPTTDRYTNPALCSSLRSAGCARLILQVLKLIRTASATSDDGQVVRVNLEALLLAHPDETLRSAGPDIFGNDLPTACGWGVVVDVLRERSCLFVDLNLKVLEGVMPKHAGAFRIAFRRVDPEGLGIANAQEFLSELLEESHVSGFPSDADVYGLQSALKKRIEGDSVPKNANRESPPITWEEVLALMALAEDPQTNVGNLQTRGNPGRHSLLGNRVRLLTGRSQAHTNSLPGAYSNLSTALCELKRKGMGNTTSCVPTLNALAETLALFHRRHLQKSKIKAKKLAKDWAQGDEGQDVFKEECRCLLQECRGRTEVIFREEVELKTWQTLVAYRAQTIARDLEGQGRDLEFAEKHLLRAWEILESRYGRYHTDVGAACVSLGNLAITRNRQDEAENWFRRALETFERCFAGERPPVSASIEATLGKLLVGQGQQMERDGERSPDKEASRRRLLLEATRLIEKAAAFYSERVETNLRIHGYSDTDAEASAAAGGHIFFARSDLDIVGSWLDPQTACFARRAAELWIQVADLRESVSGGADGGDDDGEGGGGTGSKVDAGVRAEMFVQAARATEISRGACSVALAKVLQKLGEVRQGNGDYAGAREAFSRAHAIYTDRYGRQDPRAKSTATAVSAATAAVACRTDTP